MQSVDAIPAPVRKAKVMNSQRSCGEHCLKFGERRRVRVEIVESFTRPPAIFEAAEVVAAEPLKKGAP